MEITTTTPQSNELSVALVPQIEQNLPSDAKNKAISDLTAACYQKASQLQLTKEEIAALSADFPDEAFQPGAAGKENLIYIEHAALRERLDQVIGMGQWCVIPIRRWEEKFTYEKEIWQGGRRTGTFENVTGSHVYVDGIMLIRGAFVGSAIGEMTYYPDNHTQNYGDAVEGAETASLRRCCKRLGIGLQAWRKDWCESWWHRKRRSTTGFSGGHQKAPQRSDWREMPPLAKETPKAAPSPVSAPTKAVVATERHRLKALNNLQAAPGQANVGLVEGYLRSKLWITGGQGVMDFPLEMVPTTKEDMQALTEAVARYETTMSSEVPQ